MHASDLMEDYPAVDVSTDAAKAAQMMVSEQRPALLVFDGGKPKTVLPASEVLGYIIPPYIRDDPSLVGVLDEKGDDTCALRLKGRSVRDLLGEKLTKLPAVEADATALECAAVMAKARSPLCVVLDDDANLLGAVTASRVIEALLP